MLLWVGLCQTWAGTTTWTGTGTGGHSHLWGDSQNWTGSLPGSGVDVYFTAVGNGNSTTPSIAASASANSVIFSSNADAFILGGTSSLTISGTGSGGIGIINNSSATQTFCLATLTLGGSQKWVANSGSLAFSGSTAISIGTCTLTIDGDGTTTIAGPITGSGGGLVKAGSGTLSLSGANSYSGATSVSSGVLIIQNATALGNTAQTVTIGKGASLQLQGGIAVGNKPLNLSGNGPAGASGGLVNLAGSNSFGGLIALGADSTIASESGTLNLSNPGVLRNPSGSSSLTLAGAGNGVLSSILGTNLALTKTGEGTWTLSGSGAMTGPTVINSGTLKLAHTWALQASTLSGAGSVGFESVHAFTIGGLSGNLSLSLQDNAAQPVPVTLNVGNNNTSTTFSGSLTGAGSLSKVGSGTLTLSGSNSHSGSTTVSAGVLAVQDPNALGKTSGGTTVASGATLQVQGGISIGAEPLTLNGSGAIGSSGALVNLSGTNTFAALISLGASATISSDADLLNLSNPGIISGTSVGLTLSGAGDGVIAGIIGTSNSGPLTKKGSGTWTLGGMSTYSGATTLSAGTLSVSIIGNGGLAGNLGQATSEANRLVFDGGTLQYTGSDASSDRSFTINPGKTAMIEVTANTLTLSGSSIFNSGALTKTGPGSLVLSGRLYHTGTTSVQAGTLIVSGSLSGTTALSVSTGASLVVTGSINSAAQLNVSGALSCLGHVGNIVANSGATVSTSASPSTGIGNATGLSLGAGAHLSLRIGGTSAGTGYDQLNLNRGGLILAGDLQGTLLNGFRPDRIATTTNGQFNLDGQIFYLVIGASSVSGQFSNQQSPAGFSGDYPYLSIDGQLFAISYQANASTQCFETGGSGHDIALMAVPEPNAPALLLLGSLPLLYLRSLRWRRQRDK